MHLFDGVLREVVSEYGQPVEYWPSSPSANFEDAPGSSAAGDVHYWEVWHARAPIENYKLQFPRFMSEYGFQSFPEMKTVKTFSVAEDWDIESKIMLAHQKNVGGNARIHDYMLNYYGEPKDFASFLYVSQVLQAEAIKVGAEHLRRQRPRTMGSLYWQLNDCWPVASWASIDYYGHWKALQYYARRFYNDLLVSPNVESGSTSIYVVSDRTTPTPAKLRVRLMNYVGNVVQEKNQDVTIEPLSSKILLQLPTDTLLTGKSDHFLIDAELLVDNKVASRNLLFLNRMKDVTLPKPRLTATIDQAGQNYRVRVQTNALARDVYVSFGDLDVTTSDNYIDMLPGETAEITVTSKASLADLRKSMQVISLVDAIVPGSGNRTATTTASRR